MTAFNSKGGGFQLTPVGRVQTPTLAILAESELTIRDFNPRTYFEVFGDFDVVIREGRVACVAGSEKLSRSLVRRELQEEWRRRCAGRTDLGEATCRGDRREVFRKTRHHRRGEEADHADRASALRSHHAPTRGQRPLLAERAPHAPDCPGAVRATQGPHLSADRFALSCPKTTLAMPRRC